MPGEPAPASLAEARLVPTTCQESSELEIEVLLTEMHAAVDESIKEWRAAQPACRDTRRWGRGGSATDGSRPPPPASVTRPIFTQGARPPGAASASGTNNQVAGVDEADIVKTDGRWVYLVANGALRILEGLSPEVVSVTKVPGDAREMFVEGDRAVVYTSSGTARQRCTYGYDCTFGGDGTATKILVFDISDRAKPKIAREIDLSGSLLAARRIGNAVHTVVADGDADVPPYETWPANLSICGTSEKVARERFAKLRAENEARIRRGALGFPTLTEKGKTKTLCSGLMRTAIRDGRTFTSVVSFDLSDDASPPATATMQSRPGAVFASENALYVSVVHQKASSEGRWYSFYSSVDEASEIHKFAIGAKPAATKYVGSGIVPGHVLNQFAMDEWYGYLRVATSRGQVPDPNVHSIVSVLAETEGGHLVRVGAIDEIAPGEDIRAVRFDDDRAYVVTFKKTDPLFVMDLGHPAKPRILGELKIPGFSTYIHRIDPEHLLSIGFDADDEGSFAYFDGVLLQLFDVKNPTDPKLLHKEKIGTRGSSSAAATDHLAFNFLADRGLVAIPMTICEGGGRGRHGREPTFSGLLVYGVDIERGFERLGGIDHAKEGATCNTWWSTADSAVKRSVFLDDLVYSIAKDRVKVQRMSRFGTDVADIALDP